MKKEKKIDLGTVQGLEEAFEYLEFLELGQKMLFRDLELWDKEESTSIQFETYEDVTEALGEDLSKIDCRLYYHGGRGADSGEMGGGFADAGGAGRRGNNYKALYPTTFNRQGRFANQERAIEFFREKYGGADREYGISVDEQGFIHRHLQGGPVSVPISTRAKNHMVDHNHPNGGAFSKSDLLSTTQDHFASGIIATSSKATYEIRKTKNLMLRRLRKP